MNNLVACPKCQKYKPSNEVSNYGVCESCYTPTGYSELDDTEPSMEVRTDSRRNSRYCKQAVMRRQSLPSSIKPLRE